MRTFKSLIVFAVCFLAVVPVKAQITNTTFRYISLNDNGQGNITAIDILGQKHTTSFMQVFPKGTSAVTYPLWISPNKEWIAINYLTTTLNVLRLFNLNTGEIRDISPINYNLILDNSYTPQEGVVWSPNSENLVFAESDNQHSSFTVYIYDVTQSRVQQIDTKQDQPYAFVWSPDSSSLIVQAPTTIVLFDTKTNSIEKSIDISNSAWYPCDLQLSPNADYLAFISACLPSANQAIRDVYLWDISANKLIQATFTTSQWVAAKADPGNITSDNHLFWSSGTELLIGMFALDDFGDGHPQQVLQTLIYDTTQNKLSLFSSNEIIDLAVHPSNQTIAVSAIPAYQLFINKLGFTENAVPATTNIKVLPRNGSGIMSATALPAGTNLSWSPDGKMLAYQQTGTNNFIFVTDGSPPAVTYTFSDSSVAADPASKTAYILPIGWVGGNSAIAGTPFVPTPTTQSSATATPNSASVPGSNQIGG